MAPYEELYDRKCRSPLCWTEVREAKLHDVYLVQYTSEMIPLIREWLKIAFNRQKSYVDPRRKDVEFAVGEYVFLTVSPMKGVMRFGKKVFHISMLRKYVPNPSHVLQPDVVELNENLTFEEQLIAIVDYQMRQLRSKQIPMVKALWRGQLVEECTRESERDMRSKHPYLFNM
ncbi:uncharacterized protein LOC110673373 [Hevea brasiliensis]|uniref:uncharacterized protein LOC110673373 n=1 Tax=Hevea brasiliensis TaxID=3981 RepID=UPI0026005181|nr:uncharacterized protein LOC110673373 [Hevea brasiliensis]